MKTDLKSRLFEMMNEFGLETEDVFGDIVDRLIQVAPSEVENYIEEVTDYIGSFGE